MAKIDPKSTPNRPLHPTPCSNLALNKYLDRSGGATTPLFDPRVQRNRFTDPRGPRNASSTQFQPKFGRAHPKKGGWYLGVPWPRWPKSTLFPKMRQTTQILRQQNLGDPNPPPGGQFLGRGVGPTYYKPYKSIMGKRHERPHGPHTGLFLYFCFFGCVWSAE